DPSERRWLSAATVGAAVFLVALASVISGRGLVAWDALLGRALAGLPLLPARVVDVVGGTFVVAPLVALAAVFLWTTGRRCWAAHSALTGSRGASAACAPRAAGPPCASNRPSACGARCAGPRFGRLRTRVPSLASHSSRPRG